MRPYQQEFLTFAIDCAALRFGRFTLKSGRVSPYFFNSGTFNTGARLARLARYYAEAIVASGLEFDMVYGPAYKGIPLATAVATALAEHHGRDVPYAFNRKEAKGHGEGGIIVGAPIGGRVLIVDDVISAGISVQESVEIIRRFGGTPAGVAIALDRQERGTGALSAVQEVEQRSGLNVISIADLGALRAFLAAQPARTEQLDAIDAYRRQYGAAPA